MVMTTFMNKNELDQYGLGSASGAGWVCRDGEAWGWGSGKRYEKGSWKGYQDGREYYEFCC